MFHTKYHIMEFFRYSFFLQITYKLTIKSVYVKKKNYKNRMKHTHILIYYTVYKGLYDAHRHISFSQK